MSIKFSIKHATSKALKEGDTFVRYSGYQEPFFKVSYRTSTRIGGTDENPIISYTTGLDESKVEFLPWYNAEEKKEVVKQIKELKPLIVKQFGGKESGKEITESTNTYFWGRNRDISRLSLTNEEIDRFYDTKYPTHALLYLSIINGAFDELVAPTRDWADRNQIPFYLALETDETFEDEDDITRSDAHAALSELRKDADPKALFILAWCIQYDTQAFGGINASTPLKNLIITHSHYIDGKLSMKKKKNTPKVFLEYYEKWKGQQTRPALYTEAYIKAGEYFNYINQREKKYVTSDGTLLGNTIPEAIETIMKPKHTLDLEKLRDQVEKKWKE